MKKFLVLFTALLFLVTACDKEEVNPIADEASIEFRTNVTSTPVSSDGITPHIIPVANTGGNRTCDEVDMVVTVPKFTVGYGLHVNVEREVCPE